MTKTYNIVVLPGDGIGPEVTEQASRVLEFIASKSSDYEFKLKSQDFGGIAIDNHGVPLPDSTIKACEEADAMLLGAVGGPKWGVGKVRPEQGLLQLRKHFDLYANVRPALFPSKSLLAHSPLKPEIAEGTNMIVVRELVKGLYFGDRVEADLDDPNSKGEASDMMIYNKFDVQRITRLAAALALQSNPPAKIHSIDKANVLACSRLWRRVVQETIDQEFASQGVEVDHQLVDSAAMIMVSNPRKLNGIVLTENMFGDILSDESSVIPGSLGLLPSASLSGMPDGKTECKGLYEPIHGTVSTERMDDEVLSRSLTDPDRATYLSSAQAPDIAGQGKANPIGTILSAAMLLRYSFGLGKEADAIYAAVEKVLDTPDMGGLGLRTADLGGKASTSEVGDKIIEVLGGLL